MRGHPSHDDLAGFALGALDEREQNRISSHLKRCDACTAELSDRLLPAVDVLAESVKQVEPPDTLRQSLMATVHEEARTDAAPVAAPAPKRSRLGAFLLRPVTGLAIVALLLAGVGGYLIADNGGSSDGRADTVELGSAETGGTLHIEGDDATLTMHGMPQLNKGAVYQVWVADNGNVTPSADFIPDSRGGAKASIPEAAQSADQVMITKEPYPGRTSPTLPPVLGVELG